MINAGAAQRTQFDPKGRKRLSDRRCTSIVDKDAHDFRSFGGMNRVSIQRCRHVAYGMATVVMPLK
jgi:hypothetical protein